MCQAVRSICKLTIRETITVTIEISTKQRLGNDVLKGKLNQILVWVRGGWLSQETLHCVAIFPLREQRVVDYQIRISEVCVTSQPGFAWFPVDQSRDSRPASGTECRQRRMRVVAREAT